MADILGEAATWDWERSNAWPAVVRLSDRVKVDVFTPVAPEGGGIKRNTIAVSDRRTLAGARVTPLGGKRTGRAFLVFSVYARWLDTHPRAEHSTSRNGGRSFGIYSDGSAHRAISDLSAFIGHTNPSAHRMLVAGDLNTIYGTADNSRLEKPARARSIFDRMLALGFEFVGPQWPDADTQADPTPQGLPKDTRNVPTWLSPWQRRRMRDEGILSGNQLALEGVGSDIHAIWDALTRPGRFVGAATEDLLPLVCANAPTTQTREYLELRYGGMA